MAFRDLVLRWTSEGVKQVTADVDKVDQSTKGLGENTEKLKGQSGRAFGGMSKGLRDIRLQALLAVAAIVKLRNVVNDVAGEGLTREAEKFLLGASDDEFQALQLIGAAGGLDREEAARDISDLYGALLDKIGEIEENPESGFEFDFRAAGLDPEKIKPMDPLQLVGYLQEAFGGGEDLSPAQAGAIDRLFSGDKRALAAAVTGGLSPEDALTRAAKLPDLTDEQLSGLSDVRQDRAFHDALNDYIKEATAADKAGQGAGLVNEALTGVAAFFGQFAGVDIRPQQGEALADDRSLRPQHQRVEVVVDNPAFAIKERNDAGLGYR